MPVPYKSIAIAATVLLAAFALAPLARSGDDHQDYERTIESNAHNMIDEDRRTFRFDTFGDQAFWSDTLKLHQAIAGSVLGGVGAGVTPATALAVGLKVDVDALRSSLKHSLASGQVNLDDSATTVALLKLNSVVGVTGFFDSGGTMQSIGIQCALCHSTVDNSFAAGIGHRLDEWANRDLNVGAIVALSPDLSSVASLLGVNEPTVRQVLNSWGPGKFDAQLFLDGKAPRWTVCRHVNRSRLRPRRSQHEHPHGFGSTTYWNAFVANPEMHGSGTFYDPRLADFQQFPVGAKAGVNDVRPNSNDLITSKLAALHFYQLAIPAPKSNHQDVASIRGHAIFNGKAQCSRCHVAPLFTEPGYNMHTPQEIGIDDFQSSRSPTKMYRTSPLRGLMTHAKGGFYHDGRFATLEAVVDHYDTLLKTSPTAGEKQDLIAYLKGL